MRKSNQSNTEENFVFRPASHKPHSIHLSSTNAIELKIVAGFVAEAISMEPIADVDCLLKVNVNCEACKMKMIQLLSSICGVYSVTIDAAEGTAKVSGEVDPNILLRGLARSGNHAELVWVKLKHPVMNNRRCYYTADNGSSYAYHHHHNGGIEEPPYSTTTRYRGALPERSYYYGMHQHYPPITRTNYATQYPSWYTTNSYY
ncbi:unnamed protein product [Ilex paraguariensis]|uniref:HMA domain-containing protein n=1 Tax=Ilex paraguariensis TaxID=185542 RepID=A0ABC8RQ38_9AQUA